MGIRSQDRRPSRARAGRAGVVTARGRLAWLALALVLALVAAACGGTESGDTDDATDDAGDGEVAGPEVTLRLGHGFPPEHVLQRELLEPWAAEVAEATGGSVTVEIHAGGALTEAPAAYENTVAGVADIAWSIQGYTPGRFPITEIVELPFLFDSAEEATGALWELYQGSEAFQAEYGDVKVLALWTLSPGMLWTRDTPVASMEDVAGLTLRAPGRVQIDLLESLGASPLTMPAPEIFDALERGVMQGLVIDPVGVGAFGLAEVLGYALDASFYTSAMFLVMNQGSWESLSAEQQAAVDEVTGRDLSLRIARLFDDASAGVLEGVSGDIDIAEVDDVDAWRDATRGVTEGWIAEAEAAGHPAQELYDQLLDHLGLAE